MTSHQITLLPRRAISRLAVFATLLLAIALLSACGAAPATRSTWPTATAIRAIATRLPPTSVTVVRFSTTDRRVPPFQGTTQDTAKVQQLYHALDTAPYLLPSSSGCMPLTEGMGYELSFMHGSTLVLQVVLQGGCPGVPLSNSADCRQWTPALTAQIAATFGVPTSALMPLQALEDTAEPSGPFAQPAPTAPTLTPVHCF